MGLLIEYKEKSVWEPGRISGTLFTQQIRTLEVITDQDCGIVERVGEDTWQIELPQFSIFLQDLGTKLKMVSNSQAREMALPAFRLGLALHYQAIGRIPPLPEDFCFLEEEAIALSETL